MRKPLRVLMVEDSEDDAILLLRELRRGGYDPIFKRVDTPESMTAELDRAAWDIIISDYVMPQFNGLEALRLMQGKGLDLPFIVISGKAGENTLVGAMKAGVHDYILKNNLARLIPAVERELREAVVRRELQQEIEEQRQALLEAERQRVMMESVEAACHHFAQPLTTMLSNLQLLSKGMGFEESDKSLMFEQCLKAAEVMKTILNKFRQVREYRTRPYLADTKILDIGLDSIYGTPGAPEDTNKSQWRPDISERRPRQRKMSNC